MTPPVPEPEPVIPDTSMLELLANQVTPTGGEYAYRHDGRSVYVYQLSAGILKELDPDG